MKLTNYFNFLGNLYGCPYGIRVPECPIYPIDCNTFREKFDWFVDLSNEEKDSVVVYHCQCLEKRSRFKP
jgi:hypothetical protein